MLLLLSDTAMELKVYTHSLVYNRAVKEGLIALGSTNTKLCSTETQKMQQHDDSSQNTGNRFRINSPDSPTHQWNKRLKLHVDQTTLPPAVEESLRIGPERKQKDTVPVQSPSTGRVWHWPP